MTAREIALVSFWSERPLVRLYIERTGRHTFSLVQLIAFAEALPKRTLNRLKGDQHALYHDHAQQ
jgi:hypothetical protein